MSKAPVDFDKFLGEIDTAKVAMARYDPTRNKLGHKIHPRSQLARRRNMLLGRFAFIAGATKQLEAELRMEYGTLPVHAQWQFVDLHARMESVRLNLAKLKDDCDLFYQQAYNIKTPTPKPELPTESEK